MHKVIRSSGARINCETFYNLAIMQKKKADTW